MVERCVLFLVITGIVLVVMSMIAMFLVRIAERLP